MWPWEHLAVGYLGYSLLSHVVGRRRPRGWPVVALAVGTQFPDLVDKPLAWTLGVLPAGHSLAHSALVALPVSILAVAVGFAASRAAGRTADRARDPAPGRASDRSRDPATGRSRDHAPDRARDRTSAEADARSGGWSSERARVGLAFAFGYLSHLPGDVFYPVLVGGEPNYDFLLWPLVPVDESAASVGFVEMFRTLFGRYIAELAGGEIGLYLGVELGLLASVVVLWLLDGVPPLGSVWSWAVPEREADEAR